MYYKNIYGICTIKTPSKCDCAYGVRVPSCHYGPEIVLVLHRDRISTNISITIALE